MSASAETPTAAEASEESRLADDIARAMQHRPLLSRLARVEQAVGGGDAVIAAAAGEPAPDEAATTADPPPADPRSIEEVIDDLGYVAAPPPSAEWLDTARRAHREAQLRQGVAWLTTLSIAVAIIGVALLLLRV